MMTTVRKSTAICSDLNLVRFRNDGVRERVAACRVQPSNGTWRFMKCKSQRTVRCCYLLLQQLRGCYSASVASRV
jgi:hypothetical protein